MIRDPYCDNDDCEFDPDLGRWVHAEEHDPAACDYPGCSHQGCDADEHTPLTLAQALHMVAEAPPNSFLATTFGPALRKAAGK